MVELTIIPKENYKLAKVTLTESGKTVELTPNAEGKYVMPNAKSSATIKAVFSISGSCGNNLSWNLDGNGVLTISGSGDMLDWNSEADVPWHANRTCKVTAAGDVEHKGATKTVTFKIKVK